MDLAAYGGDVVCGWVRPSCSVVKCYTVAEQHAGMQLAGQHAV